MAINEDSRVKIPTILHLIRLGYEYLPLSSQKWDESNNVFSEIFEKSLYRIRFIALGRQNVCKVIEDVQSIDLKAVRESMKKWPIELKGERAKNKAEKFTEDETLNTLRLVIANGWDSLLLNRT